MEILLEGSRSAVQLRACVSNRPPGDADTAIRAPRFKLGFRVRADPYASLAASAILLGKAINIIKQTPVAATDPGPPIQS